MSTEGHQQADVAMEQAMHGQSFRFFKKSVILVVTVLTSAITYAQTDTVAIVVDAFTAVDLARMVNEYPSNKVALVSCKKCDEELFNQINSYRNDHGLNKLNSSIRLDTLAEKVLKWNILNSSLAHYSKIVSMNSYFDLLNAENLMYIPNPSKNDFEIDLILDRWKKSESHNKNLLLQSHDLGSALIMLVVSFGNGNYFAELFAIFESDYHVSKRELSKRYDDANKKIWSNKKVKNEKP